MEDRQRDVLERNRHLLLNNMILTPEFYDILRSDGVLPETMIRDIQAGHTREQRNARLLGTLQLRGGDAYRKFRHVLYLTGHVFLADHLYGEDMDTKLLRAEDVFGKFPNLFNHISDDMKSKLLRLLDTKVREKALTTAWQKSGPERCELMILKCPGYEGELIVDSCRVREKALTTGWLKSAPERCELMEMRKVGFNSEKDFRMQLDSKAKKIMHLNSEVDRLNEEIARREEDIHNVKREINNMRIGFKDDLAKQARFNAANNSSVLQLRGRFDSFNERVRIMNIYIREFLDPTEADIDDDQDNMKISVLERNVRRLVHTARTNIENTSSSLNEKQVVHGILNTSSRQRNQPLSEVVRQYAEKQEKAKTTLSKELQSLLDVIRGGRFTATVTSKTKVDLKMIKTQMATLREEMEHMKKKLDWKDGQITDLIQENTLLKQHTSYPVQQPPLILPKIQQSQTSLDSPDSTRDIEKVYQQFDRYMDEFTPPPPASHSRKRRGSLADVNLERDQCSPAAGQYVRRNSKIETVDLDILGTATATRSRSNTDLGLDKSNGEDFDALARSTADLAVSRRASLTDHGSRGAMKSSMCDKMKSEYRKGKDRKADQTKTVPPPVDRRRHSLAELITIYETSNEEPAEEGINSVTSGLPNLKTVQET